MPAGIVLMADLYLHLVFARRLRFAEGLNPLCSEALARRPSLVALGACLAALPGNERRGMSFLRRLFSRASEVARWQKLLSATPGSPRSELIVAVMAGEPGGVGGLVRLALGLGLLSYELLEGSLGVTTAGLQIVERAAIERAQARLWLQATLPREKDLAHELRPVLALADGDAARRALAHANRAIASVHGGGPGEAVLQRWVRSLVAEAAMLVEKDALPPALGIDDQAARGPHFESAGFVEKVQATINSFVLLADRVGEAFTAGEPDAATLAAAMAGVRSPEWSQAATDELQARWRAWLKGAREAALVRGRNTKPAFIDGEGEAPPEHRQRGVTSVMSLADLPPEAADVGAPPLPEMSGPNVPPPPPPNVTQEVSVAQIEAEAGEFVSPPHTQEVSVAQIESEGFEAPAHTQEVMAAQVLSSTPPPPNVTQPIVVADIIREQEAEAAASAAASPAGDGAPSDNGTAEPEPASPPDAAPEPPPSPADAAPPPAADVGPPVEPVRGE